MPILEARLLQAVSMEAINQYDMLSKHEIHVKCVSKIKTRQLTMTVHTWPAARDHCWSTMPLSSTKTTYNNALTPQYSTVDTVHQT